MPHSTHSTVDAYYRNCMYARRRVGERNEFSQQLVPRSRFFPPFSLMHLIAVLGTYIAYQGLCKLDGLDGFPTNNMRSYAKLVLSRYQIGDPFDCDQSPASWIASSYSLLDFFPSNTSRRSSQHAYSVYVGTCVLRTYRFTYDRPPKYESMQRGSTSTKNLRRLAIGEKSP